MNKKDKITKQHTKTIFCFFSEMMSVRFTRYPTKKKGTPVKAESKLQYRFILKKLSKRPTPPIRTDNMNNISLDSFILHII